jgi:YegS/Rv2252/BmrU family lipid kinase
MKKRNLKERKIVFIINPVSGTQSKLDFGAKIYDFYKNKGVQTSIEYTQKANDAKEYAKAYVKEKYDAIIAVGGDGTVNEVLNGIGKSGVTMGIVPSGSGNGLARHLHLPLKLNDALNVIYKGNVQAIDVLKVNKNYSANVSGVGFDAHVAYQFQNAERRGLVTYARIILSEFSNYKSQEYKLVVDGIELQREAFLISFANSSQFGNNALISPNASVIDGFMDLCIVKPFAKIYSPFFVEQLMTGKLEQGKYLEIIRVREVILEQNSNIYHLDGDAKQGANILKVKVKGQMINMIVPKSKMNLI